MSSAGLRRRRCRHRRLLELCSPASVLSDRPRLPHRLPALAPPPSTPSRPRLCPPRIPLPRRLLLPPHPFLSPPAPPLPSPAPPPYIPPPPPPLGSSSSLAITVVAGVATLDGTGVVAESFPSGALSTCAYIWQHPSQTTSTAQTNCASRDTALAPRPRHRGTTGPQHPRTNRGTSVCNALGLPLRCPCGPGTAQGHALPPSVPYLLFAAALQMPSADRDCIRITIYIF